MARARARARNAADVACAQAFALSALQSPAEAAAAAPSAVAARHETRSFSEENIQLLDLLGPAIRSTTQQKC